MRIQSLTAQKGITLFCIQFLLVQNGHGEHAIFGVKLDAANASTATPGEDPNIAHRKADGATACTGEQDILRLVAERNGDEPLIRLQLHGNFPIGHDVLKVGEAVAAHRTA